MIKGIVSLYLPIDMIKYIEKKTMNKSKYVSTLIKADMIQNSIKEPVDAQQLTKYEDALLNTQNKNDLKDETYWHAVGHWNQTIKKELGRKAKAQDYNKAPLQQTADNTGVELSELLKDIDEYKKS